MYLYRYNNEFYLYIYQFQWLLSVNTLLWVIIFWIRKQQKNIVTVKIVDERVMTYDENDFIDENKIIFKGVYQNYFKRI